MESRKIDKDELEAILRRQGQTSGSREKSSDQVDLHNAELKGADLSKAFLSGINLSQADLRWANLSEADLSGASLRRANLQGANLSRATARGTELQQADLRGADLKNANFIGADLRGADLRCVNFGQVNFIDAILKDADLSQTDLRHANLAGAKPYGADFHRADLRGTNLNMADLRHANLSEANLCGALLIEANLIKADLRGANLQGAYLCDADLSRANLTGANLHEANLSAVDLYEADLTEAKLTRANLERANLIRTVLERTDLTGVRVYGISVWDVVTDRNTAQTDLIITPEGMSTVRVDNLHVAQFIYLLLNRKTLRDVIDTITSKAVLILGRFTPERKEVLDAIADELRKYNLLPIIFDFERSTTRDFSETIRILGGMSFFVIVDITNPRSAPLELQATVPDYQIPFVPIIQEGQEPFSMFRDLRKYSWVLDPVITYPSTAILIKVFKEAVIERAFQKHQELLQIKAQDISIKSAMDYLSGPTSD
jgi:uncharacterized protein YjbI with pentapeptide repeats